MRRIESPVGWSSRLAVSLMDLSGYLTAPLNHRGFYNVTKQLGKLCGADERALVRLNDDSVFELLLRDPYWNRLMHEPCRYEPEIFHCFDLIKEEPFAFVDGGANWGFWSVLATSQQYGAVETVAYEPMPATFEFLRRNAEHTGERFRVVQRAIAGEAIERSVIEASRWIDDHDCLLLFEDHAKDPTCEVTEAVLAKEWPIYFFHDDGRLDRIESVAQAAALRAVANRGYNFFGLHPGGSFARRFAAKMGGS